MHCIHSPCHSIVLFKQQRAQSSAQEDRLPLVHPSPPVIGHTGKPGNVCFLLCLSCENTPTSSHRPLQSDQSHCNLSFHCHEPYHLQWYLHFHLWLHPDKISRYILHANAKLTWGLRCTESIGMYINHRNLSAPALVHIYIYLKYAAWIVMQRINCSDHPIIMMG